MTTTVAHDEIAQILTTLKTQGVQSVALTTVEGRSLGSTLTEAGARFKLGALSAASVAIATKTSGELSLGSLDQIHVICGNGALLLGAVGPRALLSVVTDNGVDFPQLFREMRRVATQLVKFI